TTAIYLSCKSTSLLPFASLFPGSLDRPNAYAVNAWPFASERRATRPLGHKAGRFEGKYSCNPQRLVLEDAHLERAAQFSRCPKKNRQKNILRNCRKNRSAVSQFPGLCDFRSRRGNTFITTASDIAANAISRTCGKSRWESVWAKF